MRRPLTLLALVLLATAGLLAWRFRPSRPAAEEPSPLDGLPDVAEVEGDVTGRPERLVVHLRDRHLVPRDLFDRDVSAQARRDLSKEELDRLYARHLDDVEAVQKQLEAVLRELARRKPGLPVYVEGLTDGGVKVFTLKATALSDVGKTQIAEARKSLDEVRGTKGPKAALAKQYEALIARHRAEALELGAVAGPLAEGLVEVRALDDAEALKAAEPRWLGGELFDPEAVRAREQAMARRLADAEEPLVVVLLDGDHDLRRALAERAPKARYVRVTVEAYSKAAGEK
jgi:hypothetical protein